ncbi:MAG: hypothetical protein JXA24_00930 [Proteobacteria bacterium]|nr:hypothetical protein [Pseudomonadota bacterium]
MKVVMDEGEGYRLKLEYLPPAFQYIEESSEEIEGSAEENMEEEQADWGPSGPPFMMLLTNSEIIAWRMASSAWNAWKIGPVRQMPYKMMLKRREYGFVVIVFELSARRYLAPREANLEDVKLEKQRDPLYFCQERVFWHPALWCASHPSQCKGSELQNVFCEGSGIDNRTDEFISMTSRCSTIEPNVPPETHFAVNERR